MFLAVNMCIAKNEDGPSICVHMDDNIIFWTVMYMSFSFVVIALPLKLLFKMFKLFQVDEAELQDPYLENLHSQISILESVKLQDPIIREYLVKLIENECINGNLVIVKYLVSIGAPVENNALENASFCGHLEIVKYLVSIGATVGDRVVVNASAHGQLEVVKYLVSIGASVGDDAVITACDYGHLEVVKYLVSIGAKFGNSIYGDSPFVTAIRRGRLTIVKYLVSIGVPIPTDALKFACQTQHSDICVYLESLEL